MVYTVTFNPALDYTVRVDTFQSGGVNRAQSETLRFGGKGINVSVVLRRLDVDSVALGFLAGATGRALEQALQNEGLRTDFIWLPQGMTRINVKLKAEVESEINGRGPDIPPAALQQLFDRLDRLHSGDVLVLAGSVPAAVPDDIYCQILCRLDGRGVLAVVDAARDLLSQTLPYRPFLIKPNRDELGEIFGRALTADDEILDCARRLQQRGARNVLVSLAGDGSLLLDETGAAHRRGTARGSVRDSVGAGDSMVAGFLAGWLQTGDYEAAQRLGTAAGGATAFADGLATREETLALLRTL